MALKAGERAQLSRALRVKEESKQHSLALKKATAEAALNSSNFSTHKVAEFALNQWCSGSSNRSQVLSSYTGDGGASTGTNTTETSDKQLNHAVGAAAAASQSQLKGPPTGMQAIAIHSMNISQVIHSPRPPAQINNLYSQSSRGITPNGATSNINAN